MPALTRSSPRGPRPSQKRRGLGVARWARRGVKTLLLVAALAGVALAWRSGRLETALDWVQVRGVALTVAAGFRVEDVEVVGRTQTDPQALLGAVGLKRGDPILAFSPEAARQRIESLPWVASAAIERRLPDTVAITIVERRPIALWQHNERISLIDADGSNLGPVAIDSAPDLPLVVGGDAPAHTAELLGLLAQHPEIRKRIQASSWIGDRRWDLKLDNGIEVRLPETGVAEALQQLADAEASSRLFERDVAAVDLRLPGKMIVRLAHEIPQAKPKTKSQQGIERPMGMMDTKRLRHRPRGSIVAVLDVGTTKVVCFIARVDEGDGFRIVGVGRQSSIGLKAGTIVDMAGATTAIGHAVNAAEQMSGETIQEVLVNLSAGHIESHGVTIDVTIAGHQVGDLDLRRALGHARGVERAGETELLHAIPTGYAIDGNRGIEDPRGMFGQALGVQLHAVTAGVGAVKNLTTCIADTHLAVEGYCVSPYASGLSVLVDDEKELGATVIDMGGGTTEIGVFIDGVLVHADCVPVGGGHVTSDVARGLTTPLAHAERIKTLYGSCVAASTDERELIDVPQVGEYGEDEPVQANHLPRSLLVGIIQPRIEETFELVRARLEASGFYQAAGRRVVLTGGACQLSGIRDLAQLVLDKQVRIGKPKRLPGQPEATSGPAFATAIGLLAFAQHPVEDLSGLTSGQHAPPGIFGRVGSWLRENL